MNDERNEAAAADAEAPVDLDGAAVRFVRGNPSDEELAAAGVVLAAVLEAGAHADRPRDRSQHRSGWARSQRSLRGITSDPFTTPFGR